MRFAVAAEQKDFFRKHEYIAFDALISPENATELLAHIETALCARLSTSHDQLAKTPALDLFKKSYNLYREDAAIRKISQKKAIFDLASALFELEPLKIAYDQCLLTKTPSSSPFKSSGSLEEVCCFKPLAGGLVIQLGSQSPAGLPLPESAGSALFFSHRYPIAWPDLFAQPNLSLFWIFFGFKKTLFRAGTTDPYAVELKLKGHVFGDNL